MNKTSKSETDVDVIRYCILLEAAHWMKENKLEDMTQIEDEYILRQLAKFECFSLHDVMRELDKLGSGLHAAGILKGDKP